MVQHFSACLSYNLEQDERRVEKGNRCREYNGENCEACSVYEEAGSLKAVVFSGVGGGGDVLAFTIHTGQCSDAGYPMH